MLDPGADGLSIEHIVPSALGGSDVTLTCRRCNNHDGSSHDGHVVRMVRARDWSLGSGTKLKGKLHLNDEPLSMKIQWAEGNKHVAMRVPGGRPDVLERYRNKLAQFAEGDSFKITVDFGYKATNARRGLLRIAYLALFKVFGYEYILSVAGEKLRNLIRNGTDEDLRPFVLRIGDVKEVDGGMPPLSMLTLRSSQSVPIAFLIIIRIASAQVNYYPVLMPGDVLINDPGFPSTLTAIVKELQGKKLSTTSTEE